MFQRAERSFFQYVSVVGNRGVEQPGRIGDILIEQELYGFFLFFLFHKSISLLAVTDLCAFQMDSTHIGHDMIRIESPLEDGSGVELGRVFIGLPFFAGGSPFNDFRYDTFQVLYTVASRFHGVVT